MSQRSFSRRSFIGNMGGLAAASKARAAENAVEQRRARALQIRNEAAGMQSQLPMPEHDVNGDEQRYQSRIANFSKGLLHNDRGEVEGQAYEDLLRAISSGKPEDFEAIPMSDPRNSRRLVNPQGGLAFDLQGADSHHLSIPPAPSLSSAEQAAEAVELYWQALARDIPFTEYDSHPLVQRAVADLNRLTGFRGPKNGVRVTVATLFRGFTTDDLAGPYVSQFLLKPIVYGMARRSSISAFTMRVQDWITSPTTTPGSAFRTACRRTNRISMSLAIDTYRPGVTWHPGCTRTCCFRPISMRAR